MRQKPFERRGGNGGPNQPLDDRGMCGVKGVQIRVGFPFFKQQLNGMITNDKFCCTRWGQL